MLEARVRPPPETAAPGSFGDDRRVVFLAREGLRPLGFVRAASRSHLGSDRPQRFRDEIGVAAPHGRPGVGSARIATPLEHGGSHGSAARFGLADPADVAAVALYRSIGAAPETPADRTFVYRSSLVR